VNTKGSVQFGELLRRAARNFFEACGAVVEAYDNLPLDQKYNAKKLLLGASGRSAPSGASSAFREESQVAEVLFRHGWWVLERDITGPVQRELLRLGHEGGAGEVDAYLCRLFREEEHRRLTAKVKDWANDPYLSARAEITKQCLAAHEQGSYFLSVAAIMPLVDGITRQFRREVLKTGGRPPRPGKRPKTIEVPLLAAYYRRKEPALWSRTFLAAVNNGFYGNYRPGSGQPATSWNRHAILHGESIDYGTEANSLRAFLLLDTIQHFCRCVGQRKIRRRAK
jgi:hypothetical protein